ncbi:MAG: hypothetical protein ACOYMS_05820 [Terrimicrobiaceae bacterium]
MMTRCGIALSGLMVLTAAAWADGVSAYAAVRTARKVSGGAPLVEVSGESGEPRPQRWKLIFSDPRARGGVREVVVSGDEVVSERTPLRGYAGVGAEPPIVLSRLNLNSDAAFEIANRQAIARQIGFNWVDYTLRANNVTGAPVWVLRLQDHMGVPVGVITISAEDGSVIMPLEVSSRPRNEEYGDRFEDTSAGRQIGGVIGAVGDFFERSAITVRDVTLDTVGNVEEAMTGDRTVGRRANDDDDDDDDDRDDNDD